MSDAGDRAEGRAEGEGEGDQPHDRAAQVAAARQRFSQVAALPDDEIDLAEGALLIAAEEYPGLDLAANVRRLEDLARRVRDRLSELRQSPDGRRPANDDEAALHALHAVLFDEEGFTGASRSEYSQPRSSFLNDVLERKRGVPIILSVLYCEVARRAGMNAVGIGLPGHFIAQFRGRDFSVLVDPFSGGKRLAQEECAGLVASIVGPSVSLSTEHFLPASRKGTLARMLANLKTFYFQQGQLAKALSAVERILMLQPSLDQVRDRGLILRQMGLRLLDSSSTGKRPDSSGARPEPGAERPSSAGRRDRRRPDQADVQTAMQYFSAAWFDLQLYAREGSDRPDADAVREAAEILWRRMGKVN